MSEANLEGLSSYPLKLVQFTTFFIIRFVILFILLKNGDIMKKIILIFTIFILSLTSAYAGDYSLYKLDNGQTVIIQEVKNNPIVTIDTWIKTGSINEDDSISGISHFLEHLFFKGSINHPTGEFDKILETKGAVNNAATSKDYTHYYITIPSKDFSLALEMHSDMLLHPAIPPNEMEKERKVVLEEISKDANSPNSIVYENLVKLMYSVHPYKRKVIGSAQVVENVSRDTIFNYYNKFYKPSNMVTIVIGDVDKNLVLKQIKESFKTADNSKLEKISYPQEAPITTQRRNIAKFPSDVGYMLIGFRSVKVDAKDSYALDLLSVILGQGRTSVFYRNIKDSKQLAYSIGAANSGFKDDGIFYISANFEPKKLSQLENAIFSEIENIQVNGVTKNQLNTAKNMIERDTIYERESISNIANEIGYTVVTTGDVKYYDNYISNIKKVTLSDIQQVAKKYLNKNQSAVSILIPDTTQVEKPVANITSTQNNAFPMFLNEFNGTQKYKLPNGATVLITPNDINDIIAISISSKGGEFLQQKAGTANLMNSVLLKGTNKYSKEQLANLLEDNGIKISPSSRSEAHTITLLTTKNDLTKTLDILNEIVNNATLSQDEINKSRIDMLTSIKKSRDIPLNVALDEYRTLIYENTPYSNSNKVLEKSLPSVTKDDINQYYNTIFNPENMVISINGNVEKTKILNEFNSIFKPKSDVVPFDFSQIDKQVTPIEKPKFATNKINDLQTSWIILGWQVPGISQTKDYATLQVINAILGTGMSSRMFRDIREKDGLAYQLGSQYSPNKEHGTFILYIGTNPKNVQLAKDKLFKEIYTLKREYVSAKELQEAKEKLIGRYILSKETNLDKASILGWFEMAGLGYQFDSAYEKLINGVTVSDVMKVANKYFKDNYVLSVVEK